jgi:hypothetical protein
MVSLDGTDSDILGIHYINVELVIEQISGRRLCLIIISATLVNTGFFRLSLSINHYHQLPITYTSIDSRYNEVSQVVDGLAAC